MDAFLDTLLSRLAYASVQAVLLAALVYAACRLMPSLSAAARTALWWLLGAQLVLGLAWPTPVALPLLPAPAVQTAVSTRAFDAAAVETTMIAPQPGFALSWTAVLLAAWAIAILIQLAVAGVRAYRLSGVVRRAMPHDDVRVDTLCARRARELGLRRSPRLAVSAEVDSPQVVGLWRPTILLPLEDKLDDEELDMALMHELAHVRRGDLVLGWVPVLARTLFFFHPLVHVAMREYALCREAACDALVVSRGRQAPRTYGRLLLRLGVAPHPHHALPGASPTFRTLKRRIDMLGQATDAPPRVLTLCLVTMIAAIGVTPWRVVAADGAEAAPLQASPAVPPTPVTPVTPTTPVTAKTPTTPAVASRLPSPPLPPMPAMPSAPSAPPAPPAPPAPLPATGPSDQTFIFFSGQITRIANGSDEDIQRARAQRQGPGDYAWYRNGAQAWVLRDPAYVKRIREAYERARVPAEDAMRSAEKQAEIDRRQAVLNGQLAQLSAKQAELVAKQSEPGAPRDPAAYAAGNAAIGREQADIAKEIADLDKRRAAIGQEHVAQSRREADADRKANDEVRAIMDEAMHNHVAERSR